MKIPRRTFLHFAAGAGGLQILSRSARAQAYPGRPLTLIVPFAAGGPTDTIARIVAEGMRTSLGQPIIIENVGGADGSIAVGRAARAPPDGYTLSIGNVATHVLNGAAYSLSYDLLNDFEAISLLTGAPAFIDAKKTLPAKDLKELIAWLKANPNKGVGWSVCHLEPPVWRLFSEQHRYAHSIRALSRGSARDARFSRRANRSYVRSGGEHTSAAAQWQHQSLRCCRKEATCTGAGHSDYG